MAHGYGGGNGDWSPPPPPSNRGGGGGRRRAPEPSDDGWVRKPPMHPGESPSRPFPEPPGGRGMMGRPRGVDQPPAPPPGRRRGEGFPSSYVQKPDYPGHPGSVSGVPGPGIPGPAPRGGNRRGGPNPDVELSSSGFPKRRRQDFPPPPDDAPAGPPRRGAAGFPSSTSAPPGAGSRTAPGFPASASAPPGAGSRTAPGFPASASAPPGTGSRTAPGFPASTSAPPGGLVNAPRSGGPRTAAPVGAPRGAMPGARNAPTGLADPRKLPPRPARPGAVPPNRPVSPPPFAAARPRPAGETQSRWQQRVHLNPHMSKRWKATLGFIGVIVVLSVCGVSSWLIVLDEQKGVQAQANNASPKPSIIPVDISSREVDPTPLTVAEVFPNDKIVIDPSKPDEAYKIISKQEQTDCRTSTKGEISTLIQGLGCSQVIRATMRSPSEYLVTGGIFNLDTVASAEKAWDSIRGMVDSQKGGFLGWAPTTDKSTRPLALAATVVGWNMKGHYLAFCVIARSDGNEIPDRDPFASQIMYDIVEIYLKGQILEARATDPAPDASGAPAPTPKPSG